MNAETSPLVTLITRIKAESGRPENHIIIKDDQGTTLGTLTPVGPREAKDDVVCDALCAWRAKYSHFFLTSFPPSRHSTRNYLENISIPDPTRILFLIRDEGGVPVGNFGLCNISESEAELDNMIRGEHVDVKGFMYYAELALMQWAESTLGTRRFFLHVLEENTRTIQHHERVGFKVASAVPLERVDTENGFKLSPIEGRGRAPHTHLLRMESPARSRV